MKKSLKDKGIKLPRYLSVNNAFYQDHKDAYLKYIEESLGFPMFAKPVNDAGSNGVAFISNSTALSLWLESLTPNTRFELDEFIDGELYHCDSLIKNGTVIFSQPAKYLFPVAEFLKGKPAASLFLLPNDPDFQLIKSFNRAVLKAFRRVPNGATHLEFFKRNGEFIFLEMAIRTPGGGLPLTYEKQFSFSMDEQHFRLQFGLPITLPPISYNGPFATWALIPKKKGTVKKLIPHSFNSSSDIACKVQNGDAIDSPTTVADYACSIVIWNDSYEGLLQDYLSFATFQACEYATESKNH